VAGLIVGVPVATAVLVAASARLSSLVSTLLVAYLALVAATAGVVVALSPYRLVTSNGLLVAEIALLGAAVAVWVVRGRPAVPLGPARVAFGRLARRPEMLAFVAAILALLGYELLLGVAMPPLNWDSLTYHLPRAAAWAQHHGYFWVPNAPTDRINEFQPLAEQELLFLFAASGGGALTALPQYVAGLAILVAVYGIARRVGFDILASAGAALLLATLSLVGLEAMTAQNDLVAASFPVVGVCLMLGETRLESGLAGVAVAFGLGTKLTTALAFPIVAWVAAARGRRVLADVAVGGVIGFVALGMWGFVLNQEHTGHLLGHGGGRVQDTTSPSWPGSGITALYLAYTTMDLSVLSDGLIRRLAVVGVVAAVAVLVVRRSRRAGAPVEAAGVGLPFASALLVVWLGGAFAWLARRWGYPIRGPGGVVGPLTRTVNEDTSAFGPLGAVLLLALPVIGVLAYVRGWARSQALALAAALPVFVLLLVLEAKWNEFLDRFLLVPVVLAAPLFATLFRSRLVGGAFAAVGVLVAAMTLLNIQAKPFHSSPWGFTQAQGFVAAGDYRQAAALLAYRRLVPPHACVGAVLGADEPSYLLYGPRLEHRVEFLPVTNAVHDAVMQGLFYVVITTSTDAYAARSFRDAGWRVRSLGGYWRLASEPHATNGEC
jgi:hypothetical protein